MDITNNQQRTFLAFISTGAGCWDVVKWERQVDDVTATWSTLTRSVLNRHSSRHKLRWNHIIGTKCKYCPCR